MNEKDMKELSVEELGEVAGGNIDPDAADPMEGFFDGIGYVYGFNGNSERFITGDDLFLKLIG